MAAREFFMVSETNREPRAHLVFHTRVQNTYTVSIAAWELTGIQSVLQTPHRFPSP